MTGAFSKDTKTTTNYNMKKDYLQPDIEVIQISLENNCLDSLFGNGTGQDLLPPDLGQNPFAF